MHKMFEINQTKIKGSAQLGRKMVTHNFKSVLPLTLQWSQWNDLSSLEMKGLLKHFSTMVTMRGFFLFCPSKASFGHKSNTKLVTSKQFVFSRSEKSIQIFLHNYSNKGNFFLFCPSEEIFFTLI